MSKKAGGIAAAAVLAIGGVFIASHEGLQLKAYADPVHGWKVPTVCYGQTGAHVRMGSVFTNAECKSMLNETLQRKATELDLCIKRPMPDHAAAAVLSLAYNAGTGAVCGSTLVRQINAGAEPATYCAQFDRWVYSGGKDCRDQRSNCRGIVTRRKEERAMCEGANAKP